MKRIMLYSIFIIMTITIGCDKVGNSAIDIGKINDNPEEYERKEVTVKGYVNKVLDWPFTRNDYYRIIDDTGEIWVSTNSGAPAKGTIVKVRGIVDYRLLYGYCIIQQEMKILE